MSWQPTADHFESRLTRMRRSGLSAPELTGEVLRHHGLSPSDEYANGGAIRVGHWVAKAVRFGVLEALLFSIISNDWNDVHYCSPRAAREGPLRGYAAHGLVSASVFSGLLASRLPGPGTVYARQELQFHAPVRLYKWCIGFVVVTDVVPARHRVVLKTVLAGHAGHETLCTGVADVRNYRVRFS